MKRKNVKRVSEEKEFERIKVEALDKLSPQYKTKLGASMILHGFVWADTNEGLDYWVRVWGKLIDLSKEEIKDGM